LERRGTGRGLAAQKNQAASIDEGLERLLMATVIDELIFVLVWGDAPKIEKGQREADGALRKVKDRAAKQAKDIEGSNTDVADAFAKITTEAALFFAALAAFNAAKDLIIKVNSANSALGRFAKNVGASPQAVAAVGYAVERMGGSAQDAQSSINAMAKALYSLSTEGKRLPDELYRLQALSGVNIDFQHGLPKFMDDIAAAAQKLSKIDPAQARFLLQGMGINDPTANAMIKYGAGLTGVAIDLAPTNAAIKAAQDLNASFAGAQEAVRSVGSAVAEQLDPPMSKLLDALSTWIEDNKDLEASNIVKWLEGVGERLKALAKVAKQGVEFAKRGIDTLGQAEHFLDETAPRSILHPLTPALKWSDWWKSSEQFLKEHNPFDIGAHAGELPPGLTVQGQTLSRGNPMPVDIVRDSSSFLGGLIGSGGPPPAGSGPVTPGSGHGASLTLRAHGSGSTPETAPGGAGGASPVIPQPDDTVQSLAAKYRDKFPHLTSQQCVALAMAAAGIGGTVRDWRRGDSVKDTALEPGTPVATFINPDGTPSNRYAGGGIGTPGANRDHAAILLAKTKDGIWVEEQFTGSGGPHAHFYRYGDPRGGEKDAANYFAVNDIHGLPAGTHNPHRHALPAHPHTLTPLPSGGAHLSMLAGPQAGASRSTSRNIGSLQVKGSTAQEIADNLVAGIRAELA
jgi:hypothetical protein